MAILVLLVSLIGPRLLGSKQKADVNAVKTQIGMFQAALERYAVDMNRFPSTEEGLAALVSKPGSAGSSESAGEGSEATESGSSGAAGDTWDGPYLKTETLPKDPWGNNYAYEFPPTHNKINLPDIWSWGPDGQENTADDIVSWSEEGSGGNEG
jgi:general secretion pathway protein G